MKFLDYNLNSISSYIYFFNNPGLDVYHGPIDELAEEYLPNRVIDLTGANFEEIYKHLNNGKPVWVINNVMFDTVPSQYWQTWNNLLDVFHHL